MQSSFWGRFRRGLGWTPFRIAVPVFGAEVPAAAQVLFRRIPYGPFTFGYIPRGPLLDYSMQAELVAIVRALDRLARHVRAVAITIELPQVADPSLGDRLQRLGLRPARPVQHLSTRVLDLSLPLDQLQAQWKPKWRYNTRLASRHGVTVREALDPADYETWYALLRDTSRRDQFTIRSEDYYRRLWLQGRHEGTTALLLAEYAERVIAGVVVHVFDGEATYLYGASADEYRNVMAPQLLQWEAMQWAKRGGATRYDLFGIASSDDEHDPLAGVTRFKAGYGGRTVRYGGAFIRVYRPLLYSALQRARAGGIG